MQSYEQELKDRRLCEILKVESSVNGTELMKSIREKLGQDVIEKALSGTYKVSKENLEQGRAGERYGKALEGGQLYNLEGDEGTDRHYGEQVKGWLSEGKSAEFVTDKLKAAGVENADEYVKGCMKSCGLK